MTDQFTESTLARAVSSVLETMFFSAPLGPAEPEPEPASLHARVTFHGRPSGTLTVCLAPSTARVLAADFLGEDQTTLPDAAPGQVVCELANMVCGALISSLESEEHFELDTPQLIAADNDIPTARQSFQLECSVLTVSVLLEAIA